MAYSLFTALFVLATSRVARSQLRVFRSAPTRCHRQCHSQLNRTRHIQPHSAGITASHMKVKGLLFVSVVTFAGVPVNSTNCRETGACGGYSTKWFNDIAAACDTSTDANCCYAACTSRGCFKNIDCSARGTDSFVVQANAACATDGTYGTYIDDCCGSYCHP